MYHGKKIYIAVYGISICIVMLVNMCMNDVLNAVTNILLFGLISYFFYYEDMFSKLVLIFMYYIVIDGILGKSLYFIKYWDERNYYKLQVAMMQQQEKLQYENYEILSEKYRQAASILHDVDKHMKILEELYQTKVRKEGILYAEQIKEMVKPLLPYQYINNPVLDCLLSHKKRMAEKQGIHFEIDISDADVNFIKPIDMTTLFGNLIDNAMEACGG